MEDIIKNILCKNDIKYNNITKSSSGFTNIVYFVDDKFVIKLSNNASNRSKFDKEISIYKKLKFDFIPNYVSSGEFDGYNYLIITKLKGKGLFSIWHMLNDSEREDVVEQITDILKQFHRQDNSELLLDYDDSDWVKSCEMRFDKIIDNIKEFGFKTSDLEKYRHKINKILTDNRYGLVYNDAHFDNFLYDNGKVYLIDFDRVRFCPIDYDLLIFKTMCDYPFKFASEEDEKVIEPETFKNIYTWFKQYYPEIFSIKHIDERVKLYQFYYMTEQAIECKDNEWINKEINILLGKELNDGLSK